MTVKKHCFALFTILALTVSTFLTSCSSNNNPLGNAPQIIQPDHNGNSTEQKHPIVFETPENILQMEWSNPEKVAYLQKEWKNTFASKVVYKTSDYGTQEGFTKDDLNLYQPNGELHSRFVHATNVVVKGKNYIGAVYYNVTGYNKDGNSWRLVWLTPDGILNGCFGYGSTGKYGATDTIPPKDEFWYDVCISKYEAGKSGYVNTFGHLKLE